MGYGTLTTLKFRIENAQGTFYSHFIILGEAVVLKKSAQLPFLTDSTIIQIIIETTTEIGSDRCTMFKPKARFYHPPKLAPFILHRSF